MYATTVYINREMPFYKQGRSSVGYSSIMHMYTSLTSICSFFIVVHATLFTAFCMFEKMFFDFLFVLPYVRHLYIYMNLPPPPPPPPPPLPLSLSLSLSLSPSRSLLSLSFPLSFSLSLSLSLLLILPTSLYFCPGSCRSLYYFGLFHAFWNIHLSGVEKQ